MWASSAAFFSVGVFSFFINLLMLTGPLFMLQIYDRVLSSRSIPTLIVLFALVAGLFAFLGFLEFIRSRVLSRIGANVGERVNSRTFDSAMQLSLQTGGSNKSTQPLQDLGILQQYISGPGPLSLFDAPWVPIYLFVIFLFHWVLGVVAIVATILLFIIALLNDIRSRAPARETGKAITAGNQFADAGRRNAEVLTAMGMLVPIRNLWKKSQREALFHQTRGRDRSGTLTAISKALRLFFQSAILAAGAFLTIQQDITAGTMIAASIILGRALQPVEQAIVHWRGFVQARQSFERLNRLLKNRAEAEPKMPLPRPKGFLEVTALTVAAPNSRNIILRNINFSIEPGTILGIDGNSGSGKSTLARTLVGARRPVNGEVTIDNATPQQWDPEELGKYIGYLPQDIELFGGRINENIARFQPDFDEKDVLKAATLANVDKMIKKRGGYDTDIGHMGCELSGGQKQRIALARALYRDPPIVVLDEPASNLDARGIAALLSALTTMRDNGQTVVVISHQDPILEIADYLLVLEEGMQVDFGPRDLVLQRNALRTSPDNSSMPPPKITRAASPRPQKPNGFPAAPPSAAQVTMSVGTPQWPLPRPERGAETGHGPATARTKTPQPPFESPEQQK